MSMIRIWTKIEGETLVLPELKPLIGKTVVIEVTERADEPPSADRWAAAAAAVKELSDYDFDAWAEQRAFDARHAADHLE
jgi:hypothetical protein